MRTRGLLALGLASALALAGTAQAAPTPAQAAELAGAKALLDKGRALYTQGRDDDAAAAVSAALATRERILGPDDVLVAEAATALGDVDYDQGHYDAAEKLYRRALRIRRSGLGDGLPEVASSYNDLGRVLHAEGDFVAATDAFTHAYEIRSQQQPIDGPATASLLTNLASLMQDEGELDDAEQAYRKVIELDRSVSGVESDDYANDLANLASVEAEEGKYASAEKNLTTMIAIARKVAGDDSLPVARGEISLADVYTEEGKYELAKPLLVQALGVAERSQGKDGPAVAAAVNDLGGLYEHLGDFANAQTQLSRALDIQQRTKGVDHADTALAAANLGWTYVDLGEPDVGAKLLERAMQIHERALGKDSAAVATDAGDLAAAYDLQGDAVKAEALYRKALHIDEKALGADNPDKAAPMHNLAVLLEARGDWDGARTLSEAALALQEKAYGPDHPDVVVSLFDLATIAWARGDMPAAIALERKALDARERHVTRVLTTGSEQERRLFLATSSNDADLALALHAANPGDAEAGRLALLTILRRKGRLLDTSAETVGTLRAHLGPDDQKALDDLAATRAQIATRTIEGPGKLGFEKQAAQLDELAKRADGIEEGLAQKSAAFRAAAVPVTLERVQAAVPGGAALLEIATYTPFDPKAAKRWGASHYAAYVLFKTGEPLHVDLGATADIDPIVTALRASFADAAKDPRAAARALDERVGKPIRALLGAATTVLLAPDGALGLVPFGALLDERGDYLLRRYSITYLTTGRELLSLGTTSSAAPGAPVVVANPDFGAQTPAPAGANGELAGAYFPPLPGTAEEGSAVAALLAGARTIEGDAATTQAIRALHGPRVLHVATHGFFLENAPPGAGGARGFVLDQGQGTLPPHPQPAKNPLLRSGLAFAGANLHRPGDDGILTALEASAIDLWGTRLLVLSACDTGVGQVENGDGVYGLRRALALAGAETSVMSLWSVDDAATRDLMQRYYASLAKGGGRGEALRTAQLALMAMPGRTHPYFWAAFVPYGDYRPLDATGAPEGTPPGAALEEVHHGCGCRHHANGGAKTASLLSFSALALTLARRRKRPR